MRRDLIHHQNATADTEAEGFSSWPGIGISWLRDRGNILMSHTLMRCAGAKEERGARLGECETLEVEADGVSPAREERRERERESCVWFIRAGINGGSRNEEWEES